VLANVLACHVQRPWTTNQIVEQFERHGIADGQIVDRFALDDIGAVKEYVAVIGQADPAVTLPHKKFADATK
jgi:hypothetical protein